MSTPQMLSLMNLIFSKKQRIALFTHLVGELSEFFFTLMEVSNVASHLVPFLGLRETGFAVLAFADFSTFLRISNVVKKV